MTSEQNLNPQGLKAGETCTQKVFSGADEPVYYYLGFACGTSLWQQGLPWSAADRARAKVRNCGHCACSED